MALFSRLPLTRRRLGVIIAAVICAVLLSLSRAPAAPVDPVIDTVVADDVEEASPKGAPALFTSSYGKSLAMAMAEQQLLSFSRGDVPPYDEFDVTLLSTSITEDPAPSLVDLESELFESELFGAESTFFASAAHLPNTPFSPGSLNLANRINGIIGVGGGGGSSGGELGGGGGAGGGIRAGIAPTGVATNDNNPNGSGAENGSGNSSGNGSGNSSGNGPGNGSGNGPGNSPADNPGNGPGSNPGNGNGNSGRAGGGNSGPNDEIPLAGGSIKELGPSEQSGPVNVPEPSVLSLLGIGLAGLATIRRRRSR